jgi:hypothetical protein
MENVIVSGEDLTGFQNLVLWIKSLKLENKIGKSRGGNTTKIHTTTDINGIPIRLILSEGNRNDIT